MASDGHNYPYPSPSSAQQLEQQLAGGAIAAAAAAASLEQDVQPQVDESAGSASQQQADDNEAKSQKQTVPAKRKQSDRHSNRGVANLTPEQLVKKRRNDREAQRAIRERTKTKIELLEARIKELESQPTYQDLQNAIRARDAVIAENEELKQKLTTFIGSVTSYTNPPAAATAAAVHGLDHLALATSRQEPLPVADAQSYDNAALQANGSDENDSRHLDPHLRHEAADSSTHQDHQALAAPLADQHESLPLHLDYQDNNDTDVIFRKTIPEDNLRHSLTTNLAEYVTAPFQHPELDIIDSDEPATFDLLSRNVKKLLAFTPTNKDARLDTPERNAYFCSFYFLFRWLRQPDKYPLETVPDFLRPTRLQQTKRHAACLDLIPWYVWSWLSGQPLTITQARHPRHPDRARHRCSSSRGNAPRYHVEHEYRPALRPPHRPPRRDLPSKVWKRRQRPGTITPHDPDHLARIRRARPRSWQLVSKSGFCAQTAGFGRSWQCQADAGCIGGFVSCR